MAREITLPSKRECFHHLIFILFLLVFFLSVGIPAHAQKINVAYGGLWTAGKAEHYPVFSRIQKKYPVGNPKNLSNTTRVALMKVNDKLPFNILFETDTEERKGEFKHPFSLALAITRDDIAKETYKTPSASVYKTIVNAGLVLIIYQTTKDDSNQDRNTIVYSVPLVGYSVHLKEKPLTEDEEDELFINTAKKTIEEHIVKRLDKIRLGRIIGRIKSIGDLVVIDKGSTHGLDLGQKINFLDDNGNRIGRGTIREISTVEAKVKPDSNLKLTKDISWETTFIKGLTDETYQVVDFKVSSKKAQQMFNEKVLGSQVSQWFSDFLVDKAGKVVLPSKLCGEWIDDKATGEAFTVLVKDEKEYRFSLSKPRYQILLDLTGINSKMVEGNNVNEIWAYKAWLKVDVPEKKVSVKYDDVSSLNIVPGIQQSLEKNEFFELIHKLTHKAVKEGNI
ncbi:MAG: hypothetical protein N3D15_06055 [Syntrophorhabdaceae bacterium]|nr:hypothetical protein [Syntrophorhabdaceae bacterium]